MKRFAVACVSLLAIAAMPETARCAAPTVHRYVLAAGANFGGQDRPRLQYAVSDAERVARVLVDLGGVMPANEIVLKEPKLRDFLQGLDALSARVAEGRREVAGSGGGRTEVLVYYSGHADEKGLLFGEDRYSYRTFRERLDQIPADVRIAVLDACASGAFIRIKGGKTRPAFLVDESSTMRGHAFLTSSAATEAAQESDRVGASYFTHYLVSGLRGAADTSGDGKVTLSEAYQFAFDETLGHTEQTRVGPQHPSYDITMSGSGDVVMTDVRQTSATLVLREDMGGRIFVRDSSQRLVVELYKPAGRKVELGLEPGAYEVRLDREAASLVARTQLAEGARVVLDPMLFKVTTPEVTRRRGTIGPTFDVAGRNRIELRFGMGPNSATAGATVATGDDMGRFLAGVQYTRYVREDLAFTFAIDTFGLHSGSSIGSNGVVFTGDSMVVALPIGVRWTPIKRDAWSRALKPYVVVGLGPVVGATSGSTVTRTYVSSGAHTPTTFEGQFGVGADIFLARSWSFGLTATYNRMGDFSVPVGGRTNYSGAELAVGFGWLFGRGYGAR